MRVALALVLLALSPLVAGCGSGEEERAPPALPAKVLPDLSSERRSLDRAALAAAAFAHDALSELLHDAGYVEGVEREFFGRGEIFDRVVARGLRFESTEGAERYVGWVRSHPRDFLGRAKAEPRLALGSSGVLFALAPCGTCKKELPTYLAAWRRGDVVFSLLASGRGVDRERFAGLARKLDARMDA